jgi:hypothetical protein
MSDFNKYGIDLKAKLWSYIFSSKVYCNVTGKRIYLINFDENIPYSLSTKSVEPFMG